MARTVSPHHHQRIPSSGSRAPRLALAGALAVALLLAACGGGSDDDAASGGENVTLRFTWWGSDVRHQKTQDVIAAFEAENPGITVQGEFGEWSGYWDKLATQVAANDAPDVIQMDEIYLREYAGRNALLDLSTQGELNTSTYDDTTLATGEFDGGLYGLSAGVNSFTIVANPTIFEDAGVDLPDDQTWTWEDYRQLAVEITENTPDDIYGSQSFGNTEAAFTIWARQHGESMFGDDGGIGFTPATMTSFFEHVIAMRDAGSVPPASRTAEENSVPLDQSLIATNKVAMGFAWSNQLNALSGASGEDLVLLRMPSADGTASANGAFYKSSMFWSVSSRSEHPEEAAKLIDFIVNSEEAGEILLAERAVPPNGEIREAIRDQLEPADSLAVAYIEDIADEIASPPAPPPVGGAEVQQLYQRYTGEVLFDRMTPEEAADGFANELSTQLGG